MVESNSTEAESHFIGPHPRPLSDSVMVKPETGDKRVKTELNRILVNTPFLPLQGGFLGGFIYDM